MNRRWVVAGLALTSAAAAVLVFAWWKPERSGAPDVTFEPVHLDWGGIPLDTAPRAGMDPLAAQASSRFPPSRLVRRPVSPEDAEGLFAISARKLDVFDAQAYFIKGPGQSGRREFPEHPDGSYVMTTNSRGMRGTREPSAEPPDLRILVAGDSHTEGACGDDETFAARLEARLSAAHPGRSIEVWNGARGGYSAFQYLGLLERHLDLDPDVLVVAFYGGNDFEEVLTLHHYFQGTRRPPSDSYRALRDAALGANSAAVAQSLNAAKYFALWPEEIDSALQAFRDCFTEIQAICLRRSIHPIFLYLPPVTDVETRFSPRLAQAIETMQLSPSELHVHDRMADSMLTFLRQRCLDVLDLRPAFRAAGEPLYWKGELHMNLAAQELVAEALHARLAERGFAERERVRAAPAPER